MGLGSLGMQLGYSESVEACSESVKLKACIPHPLIVIDGEFGWFQTFISMLSQCCACCRLGFRSGFLKFAAQKKKKTTTRIVDCCSKKKRGGGNFISYIVQELCESQGGRPGLAVLMSLLASMDVKIYWPCFGTGFSLSLMCQQTSKDIKHHFIIYFIPFFFFWGVTYWKQQYACMCVCTHTHTHTHTHTCSHSMIVAYPYGSKTKNWNVRLV